MWQQKPRVDQTSPPPPPYAANKLPSLPLNNSFSHTSPIQMLSPSTKQKGLTTFQPSPHNSYVPWGVGVAPQSVGSFGLQPSPVIGNPTISPYGFVNPVYQHLSDSAFFYTGPIQSANSTFNSLSPTEDLSQVAPPSDPDLLNTIHLVAEHCSKNANLEAYVRENNGHEHKFRFLVGGEGSDYYRWALSCFRRGINPAMLPQKTPSESQSPTNEEDKELNEILKKYELPSNTPPINDSLQKELDELCATLIHQATPDNIRNARHWVEINFNDSEKAQQVPAAINKKLAEIFNFPQQLHLLYVVHDVLQNEVVKEETKVSKRFISEFKPYLVWILRTVYQSGLQLSNQSEEKASKILDLWLTRGILIDEEHKEMKRLMCADNLPSQQGSASNKLKRNRFDTGPYNSNDAQSNPQYAPTQQSVLLNPFYQPGSPPIPQFPNTYPSMMGIMPQFGIPNTNFSKTAFISPTPLGGVGNRPPPPPPIGGFDKRPDSVTPPEDQIPVGLMASLLKSLSKRGKNMQTAFVPYKPLDPMSTPQFLPPIESPSEYLTDRIDNFYEDLKRLELLSDKKGEKPKKRRSHRSPSRSSGSKSRSSSGERHHRRRHRLRSNSDWDRKANWAQQEMGVGEDGSVIPTAGSKGERLGLGAGPSSLEADAFERYRRQKANKYHEHIAQNQATRRDPGTTRRIPDSEKLCYICQQPGHIAKDCKYGLS